MRIKSIILGVAATLMISSSAFSLCVPDVFPADWLLSQEGGDRGHTIRFHVGKTDEEIVDRLQQNHRIRASSTYYNMVVAEDSIITLLSRNADVINAWATYAAAGNRYVFDGGYVDDVGRIASRPAGNDNIADTDQLLLVLVADGRTGCFLLTSYPTIDDQQSTLAPDD